MVMHPLQPSFIFSLWSRQESEDGFLTLEDNATPKPHHSCSRRVWGECSAGRVTHLLVGRFRCQLLGEALQPQPGQQRKSRLRGASGAGSRGAAGAQVSLLGSSHAGLCCANGSTTG